MSSLGTWTEHAQRLLETLHSQFEVIEETAQLAAFGIGSGGLVHLFGSGHSRIPVEEMFPRYGSFPGFHPIVELSMTFHTEIVGSNGQPQAMFIERVSGLAEVILSGYEFGDNDLMMVFSASGRAAVPVEMALGAKARGMKVVGVTSVAESSASPATHASGKRLFEIADLVIDIGTPPGDALVIIEGLDTPVGPGSTLVNVAVVNEIKVRTAELLVDAHHPPDVLTAASVVGRERSDALFAAAYAEHGRRLARLLTKPGSDQG
ncbi:MAG TPA: SIS domain-containing protein [Acidimicrobiia bacterium]|nr:SIS domain-containing protein [Acidimicrobiia bacterium]